MDTTQQNREKAARRPRTEAPKGAQKPAQSAGQEAETAARRPENTAASRQRSAQTKTQHPRQTEPRQTKAAPTQKRGTGRPQAVSGTKQEADRQQAAHRRKRETDQKQPAPKLRQERRPAPGRKQANRQPTAGQNTAGLPDSVSTKKRAYGNSKPKKKSAFAVMRGMVKSSVQKSAAGRKNRQEKKRRSPQKRKRQGQRTPAIIYTEPQAFNRSRFFLQLLTVTTVVVALVLGLSVFFKVETITVSGANVYDAWTVREASGISEGDNLLTFSRARAGALIKANLPYVKDVSFGIKLPDTVNIIIAEDDVVYAVKDANSQWWLINSSGRVVEQTTNSKATNYTQVLGVTLEDPAAGEKGVATESLPTQTDESGEYIPITVTGAQRLSAALEILQALEDNDIVGSAASVNVASLEAITLWYGTRYQVNLGDSTNLAYKIACMNDAILQLSDYESGILDVSFSIWADQVGYTRFS